MDTYPVSVVVCLLMLLAPAAALSFEDYPDLDPGSDYIDPGLIGVCVCNTANEPVSCTDSDGCEGTKECVASSSCPGTTSGCGDEKCTDTDYQDCQQDCLAERAECPYHSLISDDPAVIEQCDQDLSACMNDCNSARDACDTCTGMWGPCEKDDKCCGVTCDANKKCQSSTGKCVCADTKEKCGYTSTGDGIDNDCDGQTDEGCAACTSGQAQACTVSGCAGTQTCSATGTWGTCAKSDKCCGVQCPSNKLCNGATGNCDCKSPTEACGDGIDNDCDGQTDEGCAQAPSGAAPPAQPSGGAAQANNTSGGSAPAGSFQQPGAVHAGNFSGSQNLIGPSPVAPVQAQQSGGLDPNMIVILVIVIVLVVGALVAIKMLAGKKQPPAPPAAQQ